MSMARRLSFAAITLAVLATMLFPPWTVQGADGRVLHVGWSFVFAPPYDARIASPDLSRLLIEWAALAAIALLAWLVSPLLFKRE